MENAAQSMAKINKKCFDFLEGSGVPVFQKECVKIPLRIQVNEDEKGRPCVRFFSSDRKKIYMFEAISGYWIVLDSSSGIPFPQILKKLAVSENIFLGSYEVNLLKALSIKTFYTLKNFLKRLEVVLLEGNFEFCVSKSGKCPFFMLTGFIDNN